MRFYKKILVGLALLLAFLVITATSIFAFLTSQTGRDYAAQLAGQMSSDEHMQLKIGRLEGSLFSSLRISDIEISDSKGPWLLIKGAYLNWSPVKILTRNQMLIHNISVEQVVIHRQPENAPAAEEAGVDFAFDFPFEIRIENLAVSEDRKSVV